MGLDAIVRSAVRIADKVTVTLQPYVSYSAWLGQDSYGKPTYATAVNYRALVDQTVREHRTQSGRVVSVKAQITFLRPIPVVVQGVTGFQTSAFQSSAFQAVATVVRVDPLDVRDKIVLPDGTTGAIVDGSGFIDPSTGRPYLSEVYLGA